MLIRLKTHPFIYAVLFLILTLIPVAQAWWSSFSKEPMFPSLYALSKKMPFSLYWITIPLAGIGVVMLCMIAYQVLVRTAKLEIKYSQAPPYHYRHGNITYHRVGVYNAGPAVAENVVVRITEMTPIPRDPSFHCDLPFFVEPSGVRINPGQEQHFEFGRSWLSSGENLIIEGLNPKGTRERKERLSLGRDERLCLRIVVSAANSVSSFTVLALRREGDELAIHVIDSGNA